MYVFLPHEGTSLDMSGWEEWLPQFRIAHVELALPRLSVACALDVADSLGELGLDVLFQPGADFTRMGLTGHFISAIKHKAHIEVSEEGTEASASSAILHGTEPDAGHVDDCGSRVLSSDPRPPPQSSPVPGENRGAGAGWAGWIC